MVSGAGRVLGFHGGRVAVGAVTTEHLGAGGGGGLGRRIVLCEVVVPARAAGGAAEGGRGRTQGGSAEWRVRVCRARGLDRRGNGGRGERG